MKILCRSSLPLGRPLLVAVLCITLMLTACSDQGAVPAAAAENSAGAAGPATVSPKAGSDVVVPKIPAPVISLALRGVGDERVEQGEPLRTIVRLKAPQGGTDVFELAPATGAWSDAISVELVPGRGGAAVARAQAVGKPASPKATLNAKLIAGGLWFFPAAAMQKVAPGEYLLRARLVIRNSSGWNGEVVSEDIPLQVVTVSTEPYRVTQRTLNLAQEALLDGSNEQAAAVIDTVLAKTPDDIRLLTLRADIAERAGNPLAALICLHRAQRAQATSTVGQPVFELQELEARATAALGGGKIPSEAPPAWTWPPTSVLRVPDDEILSTANTGALPKPAPIVQRTVEPVANSSSPPAPIPNPTPAVAPVAAAAAPSPASVAAKSGGAGKGIVVPANEYTDARVVAAAASQWAVSAAAGSQYGKTQYSAAQAVGAPNISIAGNSPDAWCPEKQSEGRDWLEVTFALPVHATEVRVRQNDSVGAISKIEAIEHDGTTHLWWEGVDPYQQPTVREIAWFGVRVPKTSYLVTKIKITLNLAAIPGWKEIDAVQLVGVTP